MKRCKDDSRPNGWLHENNSEKNLFSHYIPLSLQSTKCFFGRAEQEQIYNVTGFHTITSYY